MHVRSATTADETAVLDLLEELMEPPGRRPPGGYSRQEAAPRFAWMLSAPDADVLVAEDGGRVVALATVYRAFLSIRHGWVCWLQDLVVTSPRRGEGIGKVLLDAATDWARDHGCASLMLDSGVARKDAHRFYLREGMGQSFAFTRVTSTRPLLPYK